MSLVQEQEFLVTVSIDGDLLGIFDTFDGGDVSSEAKVYRAGGMADPEVLSAAPATEDVTVSRGYRGERDGPLKRTLNNKVGHDITIGKQPLNGDKSIVPDSLETFTGKIKSVSGPSHNSEGTDVSKLTIVATIRGVPS